MSTVETAMANLRDLANISQQLNAKSNHVNQILQEFEAKLSEMNLGVEVWLEDDPISEAPSNFYDQDRDKEIRRKTDTVLGFGKYGDRFLLLVKGVEYDYAGRDVYGDKWQKLDDGKRKPLLQAPREIRIKAMEKVEALIEAMQNEGKRLIASIEKGEHAVKNL